MLQRNLAYGWFAKDLWSKYDVQKKACEKVTETHDSSLADIQMHRTHMQ